METLKDLFFIVVFPMIMVSLLMIVMLFFAKSFAEKACHSFGRESNRNVRFVNYNAVSWDCLTDSGDGKFISVDQLRENN